MPVNFLATHGEILGNSDHNFSVIQEEILANPKLVSTSPISDKLSEIQLTLTELLPEQLQKLDGIEPLSEQQTSALEALKRHLELAQAHSLKRPKETTPKENTAAAINTLRLEKALLLRAQRVALLVEPPFGKLVQDLVSSFPLLDYPREILDPVKIVYRYAWRVQKALSSILKDKSFVGTNQEKVPHLYAHLTNALILLTDARHEKHDSILDAAGKALKRETWSISQSEPIRAPRLRKPTDDSAVPTSSL